MRWNASRCLFRSTFHCAIEAFDVRSINGCMLMKLEETGLLNTKYSFTHTLVCLASGHHPVWEVEERVKLRNPTATTFIHQYMHGCYQVGSCTWLCYLGNHDCFILIRLNPGYAIVNEVWATLRWTYSPSLVTVSPSKPNLKYWTSYRWDGIMDKRTVGQTNGQTDDRITKCPGGPFRPTA